MSGVLGSRPEEVKKTCPRISPKCYSMKRRLSSSVDIWPPDSQ